MTDRESKNVGIAGLYDDARALIRAAEKVRRRGGVRVGRRLSPRRNRGLRRLRLAPPTFTQNAERHAEPPRIEPPLLLHERMIRRVAWRDLQDVDHDRSVRMRRPASPSAVAVSARIVHGRVPLHVHEGILGGSFPFA